MIVKETKNINDVVELLNDAFKRDPGAMHALMNNFVPCNRDMAEHSELHISENLGGKNYWLVSSIGLLNGVLELLTGNTVSMMWGARDEKNGKVRFVGFFANENNNDTEGLLNEEAVLPSGEKLSNSKSV